MCRGRAFCKGACRGKGLVWLATRSATPTKSDGRYDLNFTILMWDWRYPPHKLFWHFLTFLTTPSTFFWSYMIQYSILHCISMFSLRVIVFLSMFVCISSICLSMYLVDFIFFAKCIQGSLGKEFPNAIRLPAINKGKKKGHKYK